MNIEQTWPSSDILLPLDFGTMYDLLKRRRDTYRGFASIESNKGFLKPEASFNTPAGQEMLRILMFRVLEEITESIQSVDLKHRKEEVIDAINYLWAIPVLDSARYDIMSVAQTMTMNIDRLTHSPTDFKWEERPLNLIDLGSVAAQLGNLGDLMRNRSWMQNTQDMYFAGTQSLLETVMAITIRLLEAFTSWDEFARFYVAKDEILKFRLRSHY